METKLLKRKTISGLLWSFLDLFSSQGVQFIILMVLARMLSPDFFGLIGIALIFIAISNTLIDSGFTQALIREKTASQNEYSTVFFFNIVMSILLYIVIYFIAPLLSDFFRNEELVRILRVLSLVFFINSFGNIHRVLLIRQLNFKIQTIINVSSTIIAGIVAVICAIQGFGVWSLVAQNITLQIIRTVLLWISTRWTPTFIFSISAFKKLFGFSSKLLVSSLIDTIYNNIFSIIIGKLYPVTQLGYYTNAAKLGDVITNSMTGALQRVTYPVLSSIQNDEKSLKSSFQKLIGATAFVMFPIMVGLIAIADILIPLLLGPNWMGSIIYFKLLCIVGMIYPLHAINLNILQVKGRSDLFLKLEIIKKMLLTFIIGVSLFLSLGIVGLIGAAIMSSYLSLLINTYYSAKEISYSTLQQLKDICPSFLLSILMGVVVYLMGAILPVPNLLKLCIQVTIGILFYVVMSWIFKIKDFFAIYHQMVLPLIQKKQTKRKSWGA